MANNTRKKLEEARKKAAQEQEQEQAAFSPAQQSASEDQALREQAARKEAAAQAERDENRPFLPDPFPFEPVPVVDNDKNNDGFVDQPAPPQGPPQSQAQQIQADRVHGFPDIRDEQEALQEAKDAQEASDAGKVRDQNPPQEKSKQEKSKQEENIMDKILDAVSGVLAGASPKHPEWAAELDKKAEGTELNWRISVVDFLSLLEIENSSEQLSNELGIRGSGDAVRNEALRLAVFEKVRANVELEKAEAHRKNLNR